LIQARNNVPSLIRALRSRPNAIAFLTVPDSAVASYSAEVAAAGAIPSTLAFVHCSGALGLGVLRPLGAHRATGSFHPLQSFPEPRAPEAFRGSFIGIDASTALLRRKLERLARDLGASPRRVEEGERAVYHAAAVFASNYLVALAGVAVTLLKSIGWSEREAVDGLIPLMRGAIAEVERRGPIAALTGPIRRGDADTVSMHLHALTKGPTADLYRMLGRIALELAEDAGLRPAAARRVTRALTRNVAATRRRRQG
jgi:predicted short-subunit dehydrogenase-like oxidoreductase (DUF2520 family)